MNRPSWWTQIFTVQFHSRETQMDWLKKICPSWGETSSWLSFRAAPFKSFHHSPWRSLSLSLSLSLAAQLTMNAHRGRLHWALHGFIKSPVSLIPPPPLHLPTTQWSCISSTYYRFQSVTQTIYNEWESSTHSLLRSALPCVSVKRPG